MRPRNRRHAELDPAVFYAQNATGSNLDDDTHLESDGMGKRPVGCMGRNRSNRNLKRILTVLATGFFLAVAAHAQAPGAQLPNAPAATIVYSTPSPTDSTSPGSAAENAAAPAGDVSLYTIIDLALRNSKTVQIAEAEQLHARGTWNETRNAYIPNFSIGSGLGYSYGFPIGGPYIFNVGSNSLLFSFSQHDYIRSTSAALKAATLSVKNARQQVILDASLKYIELDNTLKQIAALNDAVAHTDTMVTIVEDRLHAGLESERSLTQAQLTRARIQLRAIQMEDHADELRRYLASMTGLDADAIIPAASTVPPLPDLDFHSLMRDEENSPVVQAALATAESRKFNAMGDKNQNYRPTVGMAFQYQLFSTFNGYQQYYKSFQQSNIAIGIQAVFPLFDPIRRDKALESKAEAVRAQRQAELTRIQNDEGNFALWHSLRELEAQEQVADLQQQLARETLASIVTQINQGAANGQPVPPQQADQYRVEERTRYVDMRDAQFNVTRTKLDLLNAVGGLEDWAKQSTQPTASSTTVQSSSPSH